MEARRLMAKPRPLMKYLFEQLPLNNDRQIKPLSLLHVVRRQGPGLDKNDVVLATHSTHTKLKNLLLQLKYWNGPASVAVYIKEESEIDLLFDFLEVHEQEVRQASFHIVMEKTSELQYPFNILRQVALDGVESNYFLAMDVDFIPLPQNCHGNLTETLSRINITNKSNYLFVLPAFSIFTVPGEKFARPELLPTSKREARRLVHRNQMNQFHKSSFPPGHAPTQYKTWLERDVRGSTPEPIYEINVTMAESRAYEPYVVGFKPGMPRYWEGKTIERWLQFSNCLFVRPFRCNELTRRFRFQRFWIRQDQFFPGMLCSGLPILCAQGFLLCSLGPPNQLIFCARNEPSKRALLQTVYFLYEGQVPGNQKPNSISTDTVAAKPLDST
eukprot:scaffold363_cov56-Cylindrotheca_fusiformis.AAC.37